MRIPVSLSGWTQILPVVGVLTCLALAQPPAQAAAMPAMPAMPAVPAVPAAVRPAAARPVSTQITDLVAAMTLDEELGMVSGWPGSNLRLAPGTSRVIGVGYVPGVARLGIPGLTFADGPAGARVGVPSTAMPAPIALASTFSPQAARDYGTVLGRDARARDQDVLFAPMLNNVRIPYAGRNFETLGEDPQLTSALAGPEIQAIQAQGTIATAKHFAENNQETGRLGVDVSVDERTLNEIELRGFDAAVQQGRPGSVMCAYPSVNGRFSCENPVLLRDILRQRWGFDGFVVSDYGAVHSARPSLEAGLDLEFLTPYYQALGPEIRLGLVQRRRLELAVSRILTVMQRFGLLGHASPGGAAVVQRPVPAFDPASGAAQALKIAQDGAVLLRNEQDLLPLSDADRASVAVIGPTARQPLIGGGGSSRVVGDPSQQVSALSALQSDGVDASFQVGRDLQGVPIPSSALSPPFARTGQHGLLRAGPGLHSAVDPVLDATGSKALPEHSKAAWTGDLAVPGAGDYQLSLQTSGAYAVLTVDGKLITNSFVPQLLTALRTTTDGLSRATATVHLTAGKHSISVVASDFPGFPPAIDPTSGPAQVRLAWTTPAQRAADLAGAVDAARKARTAVVFAYVEGEEGKDLATLGLPDGQDELIEAVAAANPRTVVVLNSGYPVLMPWRHQVRSVLDVWYPGQEGGHATSNLLLGNASPGGRLPVTFPASEADTPVAGSPGRFPGVDSKEQYAEGVFVGYRWYDEQKITPLFPFGFGLSYTTFSYSGLTATTGADGVPQATLTVTNTGTRAGTAVPQVYAGRLRAPVPVPPRQLAGTARLTLQPGESRQVTVPLDVKSLSYWDVGSDRWVRPPGPVPILAGSSSRELPLTTTLP